MQYWFLSGLLAVFVSTSATSNGTVESPLTEQELTFLCSLPSDFKAYAHVSTLPKDRGAFSAAAERRKGVELRKLPPLIACEEGQRKLRKGTEFLNGVGFTADGTLAVVSGGYVKGSLNGQGGECYFTRSAGLWSFLGCRGTWVS